MIRGGPASGADAPPLVDAGALTSYLDARLRGEGPFELERIRAGRSSETFFLRRSGMEWVLRRPPRGAFLPTAHDVLREHRVLAALAGTGVRAPRPVLACEDPGVIGAPFYVMERVEGEVIRDALPPPLDAEGVRRRIGEELVDALAELHAVDWRAAGLEGWGRPSRYLERQLKRWRGQLQLTMPLTRPLPDLLAVGGWLAGRRPPASGPPTIVHGDYRLDNVVFAPRLPARLVAILDWEMSTIGDPLADVGWMLSFWHEPGERDDGLGLAGVTHLPGFASREELAARYEERAGREVRDLAWYTVLAMWKLAILLEGSYARHLAGATDHPFFARLGEGVPAIARRALEVAGGG